MYLYVINTSYQQEFSQSEVKCPGWSPCSQLDHVNLTMNRMNLTSSFMSPERLSGTGTGAGAIY